MFAKWPLLDSKILRKSSWEDFSATIVYQTGSNAGTHRDPGVASLKCSPSKAAGPEPLGDPVTTRTRPSLCQMLLWSVLGCVARELTCSWGGLSGYSGRAWDTDTLGEG